MKGFCKIIDNVNKISLEIIYLYVTNFLVIYHFFQIFNRFVSDFFTSYSLQITYIRPTKNKMIIILFASINLKYAFEGTQIESWAIQHHITLCQIVIVIIFQVYTFPRKKFGIKLCDAELLSNFLEFQKTPSYLSN